MRLRKRAAGRRGVIFVTALVSLTVMLLVGTAFMAMASQQFSDARRGLGSLHALATAEAGINYVVWQQRHAQEDSTGAITPLVSFPAQAGPLTLAGDQAQMTVAQSGEAYEVISQGIYRQAQAGEYLRTIRAILNPPPPVYEPNPGIPAIFDYALFANLGMTLGGTATVNGDIGCNMNITLTGTPSIIGDVMAGGTVSEQGGGSTSGISGTVSTLTDQQVFPSLEMTAWLNYAQLNGTVIEGDYRVSGQQNIGDTVIYVKGEAQFTADTTFDGHVTIVAEKGIRINGNVQSADLTDTTTGLVLITPGTVRINGTCDIAAVIYAHGIKSDPSTFDGNGTANITGAVLADYIDTRGTFNIDYRRPDDSNVVVVQPQYADSYAWTVASWEQLN